MNDGPTREADKRASGEPAAFKSLTAAVANALQQDLVAGRYMPGEKLPIVHLAKDYGVSPGAVREALSRLISEAWSNSTSSAASVPRRCQAPR